MIQRIDNSLREKSRAGQRRGGDPEQSSFTALLDALGVDASRPGWPDKLGHELRSWIERSNTPSIRTLSLFSGAGGLDIGFHDAGFDVVELVEIEKRYVATLEENSSEGQYLGENTVHHLDIEKYEPAPDAKFDFIVGGPPCQSFSAAGRRASGVRGVNDNRGTLFRQYVRLLNKLQPRGFLFENVYGLTGANQGKAWTEIADAFSEAGYDVEPRVLDAADFGVPQHRDRLFIVGRRKGDGGFLFPRPTHGPDSLDQCGYYEAGLATSDLTPRKNQDLAVRGRYGPLLREIPPGLNYSFFTERMGNPNAQFAWRSKFSDFLYKADPKRPTRTLKAQGGQYTGPFHWEGRRFTIDELKRIQTFPDKYRIVGGRGVAIQQLGNSVPPQLARILALAVRDQLFGRATPAPLDYLEPKEPLGFRQRKRHLTEHYRAVAEAALSKTTAPTSRPIARKSLKRTLEPDFRWHCRGGGGDEFEVTSRSQGDTWLIELADLDHRQADGFAVEIQPASTWPLPVEQVTLRSASRKPRALAACWKALDEQLRAQGLKADLVQLSGYYQYAPAIRAELQLKWRSQTQLWKALAAITSGRGVAKTLAKRDLAGEWGVPASSLHGLALELRHVGFEIRNRSTNGEIPKGSYLVPYAFPTLTPRSVQLHKSLG
jgi:DNA (cytosine-5)-methyltransferase 1